MDDPNAAAGLGLIYGGLIVLAFVIVAGVVLNIAIRKLEAEQRKLNEQIDREERALHK